MDLVEMELERIYNEMLLEEAANMILNYKD